MPPSTTAPGVVNLNPGPQHPLAPGAHQDGADLWGFGLAIVVMFVAIAAVRLIFRNRS